MSNEKHVLYNFTREDHEKRLTNIMNAEKAVESFSKKELIFNYEPGQYIYHSDRPDDPQKDEELFRKLKDAGASYIYTWSVWADLENRWNGRHMFSPKDSENTKKFIELAHRCGLKVFPYTSTNFFNRDSELFDPDWAYDEKFDLRIPMDDGTILRLAHCSPTSPGWRAQLLSHYKTLLDEFDYDGIYIDSGYIRRCDYIGSNGYYEPYPVLVKDEIPAFREDAEHDGGMEDLISIIRAEVKRRGKNLSVFKEGTDCFRSEADLFDYMLAGECATDIDFVRERVKNYKHVVLDFSPTQKIEETEYYLNTIPFLHFPLLKTYPITVDDKTRTIIPDMDVSITWLKLFREMTTDGTYFYMETKCPKLVQCASEEVTCSLYVNRETYLVLANYSHDAQQVSLKQACKDVTPNTEETVLPKEFDLKGREIKILKL